MEAVNIRAEQLSEVCADSLIPKRQIAILNKKFKLISNQLELIQRPEEKSKNTIKTKDHTKMIFPSFFSR